MSPTAVSLATIPINHPLLAICHTIPAGPYVTAGHKLHVSGFVRSRATTGLSVPNAKGRLVVCHEGKCTGPSTHLVSVDKTYGSFNHTILFKEDLVNYLGYNPVDLRLDVCTSVGACTEEEWLSADSITITIADPRPPTAELTLNSPVWAAPNTTVVVNGTAASLLGADIAGAEVTITWNTRAVEVGPTFGFGFEDTSSPAPSTGTGELPYCVYCFTCLRCATGMYFAHAYARVSQ